MKIVTFFSFFICSCKSLGLFNVYCLYFCSSHAVSCGSVFDFRILSSSCTLTSFNLLSVVYFLSIASFFYRFFCPHWPVTESVCLLQPWQSVSCPRDGLFSTCPYRSVVWLSVCFLPAGPFPVLWSVSFSSVCFQPLSVLRIHLSISVCLFPCQSVSFLLIGLFPDCRFIFCPTVCFRTIVCYLSFASHWPACRPVSYPLVCFQFFGLFPRQNRSVFLLSVSFKFKDLFSVHWSVFFHRSISCTSVCYMPGLPVPCQSVCFPYLGRLFFIYWPVSCLSFWILFICLPVFCPFICYFACLFVGTVFTQPTVYIRCWNF